MDEAAVVSGINILPVFCVDFKDVRGQMTAKRRDRENDAGKAHSHHPAAADL
jgi:hypothetical protein